MPLQEIGPNDDKQLQELADLLLKSHKVLVITGAGISTSCGIPDFRSKDGLYNIIPDQPLLPTPPSSQPSTPTKRKRSVIDDDSPPSSQTSTASARSRSSTTPAPKLKGQDLFCSNVWKTSAATEVFYQFIASLRQKIRKEVKETSLTHKFIRTLRDGGRLMRCYTQNIDGLEAREGLRMDLSRGRGNKRRFMRKHYEAPLPEQTRGTDFDGGCEVVALHGDLERIRCTLCLQTFDWTEEASEAFLAGHAPECEHCSTKSDRRQATGKRGLSVGSLRPNIVLYGEENPSNHLVAPLIPFDVSSGPEVLLIMGTSLKVFGLQKVVKSFAKAVHGLKDGKGKVVFVNRTRPAESIWEGIIDDYIAMDCDDWVEDMRMRRPDLWLRQGELDLKTTKAGSTRKRKSMNDGREKKPSKKLRVLVEIPQRPNIMSITSILNSCDGEEQPKVARSLAPRKNSAIRKKSQSWKIKRYDEPVARLLSPVRQQRPAFSPFPTPSKRLGLGNTEVNSPQRPDWSPITILRPSLRQENHAADNEILTSDHEQQKSFEQDENSSPIYLGTLSKVSNMLSW